VPDHRDVKSTLNWFDMHPILEKTVLSPTVARFVVAASRIAEVRQPGQFVIVRRGPGAERIPLTIADADPGAGTITLVIQAVGKTTSDLCELEVGDAITDIAGPLGKATELIEAGHAVCVGGGVGTAVVHPIAQGLHEGGVRVTSVIGGRSREQFAAYGASAAWKPAASPAVSVRLRTSSSEALGYIVACLPGSLTWSSASVWPSSCAATLPTS